MLEVPADPFGLGIRQDVVGQGGGVWAGAGVVVVEGPLACVPLFRPC